MTIAVDFDGTIVEHRYLEIGEKKLRRTNTAYADCRPSSAYIKVGGLSKAECEKLIHDRIIRYLNGKEDPVVTVRMANYKISVLGEVARPGMFTVNNEEINIFEALALAGDLTIYGVRDHVKLIRKDTDGKRCE